MKCQEFREKIGSLIEPDEYTEALREHLDGCPECADYYRRTAVLLGEATPRSCPPVPETLLANVMEEAKRSRGLSAGRNRKLRRRSVTVALSAAAVALVSLGVYFGIPQAVAKNNAEARYIFETALANAVPLRNMKMSLNVRTAPQDNFEYLNLEAEMIPHTIETVLGDNPVWKISKSGRVVMCDGEKQYMWFPELKEGFFAGKNAGFVETFRLFLDPSRMLSREKDATRGKGMEYRIEETPTEILLTVMTEAQGKYPGGVGLNSSFGESNSRREYVFDRSNHLIKSLHIYILDGKRETLVLETTRIDYNAGLDPARICALPEGYTWSPVEREIQGGAFAGLSVRETAEAIFRAMSESRMDEVRDLLPPMGFEQGKQIYSGIKVVGIGDPFQSGTYPGWYVPYKIVMPDGKTKKWNLAMQLDPRAKVWMVEGGL